MGGSHDDLSDEEHKVGGSGCVMPRGIDKEQSIEKGSLHLAGHRDN